MTRSVLRFVGIVLILVCVFDRLSAQVENVPVTNQVYEFFDRLAVKGLLKLYSNAMVPISRADVGKLLIEIKRHRDRLSGAEQRFLDKFENEFSYEIKGVAGDDAVLFEDGINADMVSEKEKYLFEYHDSTAAVAVEFLGSLENRFDQRHGGGSRGVTLEQHGGRIRGTLEKSLGFFLQATDGTVFGDKAFALEDPVLQGNNKLREPSSTNFDFTEAYLRADLKWFNMEFGRERTLVGTGYGGRLLLSDNAPTFDFLKIDAAYKSVKFVFIHGSLVDDSAYLPGTLPGPGNGANKYLALHRIQIPLFQKLNLGLSEMTVYQRTSPDFGYLNPVNFYKSSEHAEGDRDNSFINIDAELFPSDGLKLYGTLLIDDIDFGKLGTGWWGNELGWQGGVMLAGAGGIENLDVVAEYTRIEPYVYSNRTAGVDYTNNDLGLGHAIGPNSDEWFLQLGYRPSSEFRTWLTYRAQRHGSNVEVWTEPAGPFVLVDNVGGNVLQGHRTMDPTVAPFLAGNLARTDAIQWRAVIEPVNNLFVAASYEVRFLKDYANASRSTDLLGSLRVFVEY